MFQNKIVQLNDKWKPMLQEKIAANEKKKGSLYNKNFKLTFLLKRLHLLNLIVKSTLC